MKKTAKFILFIFILLISNAVIVNSASALMPVPTGTQSLSYDPIESPVLSDDPAQAKPVGIGSVASGGNTLSVHIGLNQFSGPVDIYGAFTVSADPVHVNILNPNGTSFTSFTISEIMNALSTGVPPAGANPWRSNVDESINEDLFDMPVSSIPAGSYTVYLLVTPAGSLSSYYLWKTSFAISSSGVTITDGDFRSGSFPYEIFFTIENNIITMLYLGGCSTGVGDFQANIPIVNSAFTYSAGPSFSVSGTFTNNNNASGTYSYNAAGETCPKVNDAWSATRQ
ncbi:MAG: hypothetical protein HZC48_10290 [Nitrospirae bacterium]|nr:hypothetical protein [Nitrospirota bacterium]